MLKVKEQVKSSADIIRIMRLAVREQVVVDVIMGGAGKFNAYFICKDGNLARKRSLILSIPEGSVVRKLKPDMNLKMFFQMDGDLIDLTSTFIQTGKSGDLLYAEVSFPTALGMKKVRAHNRVRVPSTIELETEIRKKRGAPFRARITDIGMGGLSFSYKVPGFKEAGGDAFLNKLKGEDFIKMEIMVQGAGGSSYEIPVNGVVRRVSRVRGGDGALQEIAGIEIMMIAMGYKGKFSDVVDFITEEVKRSREEDAELDTDEMLRECDFKRGAMEDEMPDIYEAIRDGNVEEMLVYLMEWHANETIRKEIIQGMAQKAHSPDLLFAFKHLLGLKEQAGIEILFDAILERKHFKTILELFQILPPNSPMLMQLTDHVVTAFPSERVIEALNWTQNYPELQSRLIQRLVERGTVNDFIQSLGYMQDNAQGSVKMATQIADRSTSINEMVNAIAVLKTYMRGESSRALAILIARFVGKAPDASLLQVLERHVSDHSAAGEIIMSELVHRGNPDDIIRAFKQVTMDSTASMILAYGLVKHGNVEQVKGVLTNLSNTCDKARTILRAYYYKFQGNPLKRLFTVSVNEKQRKEIMAQGQVLMKRSQVEYDKIRRRIETDSEDAWLEMDVDK
ncbi:MAG: hypothetical protein HQL54_05565 [Magnetococcales bacterium]|nr:hypothetical protein [Magnetococcales bacterium]